MTDLALNIARLEKQIQSNQPKLEVQGELDVATVKLQETQTRLAAANVKLEKLSEVLNPLLCELDDFDKLTTDLLVLLKKRLEKER